MKNKKQKNSTWTQIQYSFQAKFIPGNYVYPLGEWCVTISLTFEDGQTLTFDVIIDG